MSSLRELTTDQLAQDEQFSKGFSHYKGLCFHVRVLRHLVMHKAVGSFVAQYNVIAI